MQLQIKLKNILNNMTYKFIDLFSGCGGLEDGFLQSGRYDSIASVEWLKPQAQTLINRLRSKWKYQNAEEKVLNFDIQREQELFHGWNNDPDFGCSKGLDYLVNQANGIDVIIGGPPCQAYSIAGRVRDENGMHDDYRNFLFEHYLSIVNRYKPKVFLFENVLGILSAKPNGINILNEIKKSFSKIGYVIPNDIKSFCVVNSVNFDVPQNRKRVIIVGVREDLIQNLCIEDFYSKYLVKYQTDRVRTVGEAISDLEKFFPVMNKEEHSKVNAYKGNKNTKNWHSPRYHNIRDMTIYGMLAKDIETRTFKYTTSAALSDVYEKFVGAKSPIHRYYVLRKDEPSTTIIAHLYKDGNRFIHYDSSQARSITPREAARLQSFDDDFEFCGSQGSVYQMIGNAVPPKLGKALGLALSEFLDDIIINDK
ncbi:DNA cytosine methyltransferase [Bisgaard Taxon 45]|uniref:Cytosine-specific methyltransferase n=1 Tax=Bisgaard Taxon 45 TaxID=304289 RepID=A0ABT9KG15_9PAST|nr:DNA cytosine methyltransferase [Bisgaard Taxon 45]